MKKAIYLLLASVLFVTACTEQAPRIAKYTDLYAVKGADLSLIHISEPTRP